MTHPLLMLRDLVQEFGGLRALDGVSLEVHAGELRGLIGPNGAGKTTVFNVICGVYRPTSGDLRFDGRSLAGLAPHRVASAGIARTFQNIRLWNNMPVIENLMLARHSRLGYGLADIFLQTSRFRRRERDIAALARRILDDLGLTGVRDELPRNLPYGLQRRVEIGRALALEPRLLLLDEPAAGLNSAEVVDLMALIRRIRTQYDLTVFMIEHQMKVVMNLCTTITVLDFGEVIAEGPPEAVRRDERVIGAYLGEEPTH